MIAVGRSSSISAAKSLDGGWSWANGAWYVVRSVRSDCTRPSTSNSHDRWRASCSDSPACTIARVSSPAMPMAALPPPRNSTFWSASGAAGDAQGGEDAAEGDGGGALDVVVEAADAVAVALEQRGGVGQGEVLELDARVREHVLHGGDELLEELVVGGAGDRAAGAARGTAGRRAGPRCSCRRRAGPATRAAAAPRRTRCRGPACRSGSPSRWPRGRRGRGSARRRSRR